MHVFGTEAFIHVPKQKRLKWDAKSQNGIFVGYADDVKGLRVYSSRTNKVEISRDVAFKNEFGKSSEAVVEISTEDAEQNKEMAKTIQHQQSESLEVQTPTTMKAQHFLADENNDDEVFSEILSFSDNDVPGVEQRPELELSFISDRLRSSLNINSGDQRSQSKSPNACVAEGNLFVASSQTPTNYRQAISCKEAKEWKLAMDVEIDSLNGNKT